jgi:NAD(P)-dependent dehydrogenase (short-subunit alcohol dehydrogenase family)
VRIERETGGLAAAPGSLRERVVLVVGAAGALGSAVALGAAAAGATVVLLGRKVPPLERLYDRILAAGGATPAIYPLDLAGASPDDYLALVEAIERECGRLDGIVLASAHFQALTSLELTAPEDWLRALHVNLGAPGLLLSACLPLLRRAPDAAIVVALEDPARTSRAYWGGYGVAKHGLAALLEMLADELENSRVRVHGLLPPPMRSVLRARAWVADRDPSAEDPARSAAAVAGLLTAQAAAWRGAVLDLRPLAVTEP